MAANDPRPDLGRVLRSAWGIGAWTALALAATRAILLGHRAPRSSVWWAEALGSCSISRPTRAGAATLERLRAIGYIDD